MINLKQKRKAKVEIERAVAYIASHPHMTYPQVAILFGVSVNQLRGRINHRYGSLEAARMAGDAKPRLWDRPCISCGDTEPRPHGLYRCECCRAKAAAVHDGVI